MIDNPGISIPETRTSSPEPSPSDSPRCAVLTPPGRGAVATVGVRGAEAIALAGRRFCPASGKSLAEFPVGRTVIGRFQTTADSQEELVIGVVAADEVEIHCHGGLAAVSAILAALSDDGCTLIDADRWAAEQEDDPLAATALVALGQARTERTAAILLDQYRGALRAEFEAIADHLERRDVDAAARRMRAILDRADLGLHLTQPWTVVLAGRPNAGKSTLLNALVGYERAIVLPQPGTTRDVLTATTALDGWPIELYDTAGLGQAADAIEAEGMSRTRERAILADLVLLIHDMTTAWDAALYDELSRISRRLLIVQNKCEMASFNDRSTGLEVSALTRVGLDGLIQAIVSSLVPHPPPPGSALPCDARQVEALKDALSQLSRGDVEAVRLGLRLFGFPLLRR